MAGPANETEGAVVRLARRSHERYFGKYRGIVEEVDDRGRVRAVVPLIGPEALPWAVGASPFAGASHGLVLMPEVGDRVWIEFEAGDLSYPIWTGAAWTTGGLPTGTAQRALVSPTGLKVLLDDDAGELKLSHPGGAEIKLTNGEIVLSIGAAEIKLSAAGVSINGSALEVR